MKITRRALMSGTAAASVAGLAPITLFGQLGALIRKPIPSSGEIVPVIRWPRHPRRYQEVTSAPMSAVAANVAEIQGGRRHSDRHRAGLWHCRRRGRPHSRRGEIQARSVPRHQGQHQRRRGRDRPDREFLPRLRTEKIDLIAVHNLKRRTSSSRRPCAPESRPAASAISASPPRSTTNTGVRTDGRREALDFIQIDYALDNRNAAENILPLAVERGMAVMINLPFGRGRLFDAVRGKALPEWAAEFDCTSWAQFFLKYSCRTGP